MFFFHVSTESDFYSNAVHQMKNPGFIRNHCENIEFYLVSPLPPISGIFAAEKRRYRPAGYRTFSAYRSHSLEIGRAYLVRGQIKRTSNIFSLEKTFFRQSAWRTVTYERFPAGPATARWIGPAWTPAGGGGGLFSVANNIIMYVYYNILNIIHGADHRPC